MTEDKFNFLWGLNIPGSNYKGVRTFALVSMHVAAQTTRYSLSRETNSHRLPRTANGPRF